MRGVCAIYKNKALALVTRSGSHALMNLMLPEGHVPITPEHLKDEKWHPIMNLQGHDLRTGYPNVEKILVMVRNPLERFRSSCARRNKTFEDALDIKDEDVHFWSLESMGLINDNLSYYLFPEQINLCAKELGLTTPVPRLNEENDSKKPILSEKQIDIFNEVYKNDILLYNRIKENYHGYI